MNPRSFYKGQDGTYAIEFAFVVPVLLLVLLSALEYAWIMYTRGVVEGALVAAAREGSAGPMTGQNTTDDIVKILTSRGTTGVLNLSNLYISTTIYNPDGTGACVGAAPPCADSGCTASDCSGNALNLGTAGQIVAYKVSFQYQVFSPLLRSYNQKLWMTTRQ